MPNIVYWRRLDKTALGNGALIYTGHFRFSVHALYKFTAGSFKLFIDYIRFCPLRVECFILFVCISKVVYYYYRVLQGVGEPPLCLASTVFYAIKAAILSARADAGHHGYFPLHSPATCDRIRMACLDQFTQQVLEMAILRIYCQTMNTSGSSITLLHLV